MFCRVCGAELLEDSRFCGDCGAPVAAAPIPPPVVETEAPVAAAAPEAVAPPAVPQAIVEPPIVAPPAAPEPVVAPPAALAAAPTGPGPQVAAQIGTESRSAPAKRRNTNKIVLISVAVLVLLAAAGIGAAFALGVFRPSDADLVETLATTANADDRTEAAVDLSSRHSAEATGDLASLAATTSGAADGLAALREEYLAVLSLPRDGEAWQEDEQALLATTDCLAIIDDSASAKGLAEVALSPDYGLMSVRSSALRALTTMKIPSAFDYLIQGIALGQAADPGGELREIAKGALLQLPDAPEALVEARTDSMTSYESRTAIDTLLVEIGDDSIPPLLAHLGEDWVYQVLLDIGAPALDALSAQLESERPADRYKALDGLLVLYLRGSSVVAPYLVRPELVPLLVKARDEGGLSADRQGTLETVIVLIGAPAVDPLVAMMPAADWVDGVLARMGAPAAAALGALLDSDDAPTRYRGLEVLLRIYALDASAASEQLVDAARIPLLLEAQSEAGYSEERVAGIVAVLTDIGAPAAEALVAMLPDSDWAAEALSTMGAPAEPALLTALTSKDVEVRLYSGSILAWMYQVDAGNTPQLTAALESQDLKSVATYWTFFILLGQPGTEDMIADALLQYGKKQMGLDCMNCGNETLDAAGRKWGANHGYTVYTSEEGGLAPAWGG